MECGIQRPTPIEDLTENYYLENGLETFLYDTNHDGVFDVEIMIPQGDINRYPSIYMFDRDYDGDPDVQYTDELRDGSCKQIVPHFFEDNAGDNRVKPL